jgi:phage shock protein B
MDPATLAIMLPFVSRMVEEVCDLAFFVLLIGLPCWAAVKIYRMRAGQTLRGEDAALLQGAMARLAQVEDRMTALETILDAEAPAWRGAYEPVAYGRQAG